MKKKLFISFLLLVIVLSLSLNILAEDDSLKAYRDIKFKDSESTVREKWNDDEKITSNMGYPHVSFNHVGYDLYFDFYEDQLYSITFYGPEHTADYFDTDLKNQRNQLVRMISNKYDSPDMEKELNFFDVENGYITYTHKWNIDDKRIIIGTGGTDYKYYNTLIIEYLPLYNKVQKEQEEEESENVEDDSSDF